METILSRCVSPEILKRFFLTPLVAMMKKPIVMIEVMTRLKVELRPGKSEIPSFIREKLKKVKIKTERTNALLGSDGRNNLRAQRKINVPIHNTNDKSSTFSKYTKAKLFKYIFKIG
jgi:hypothetical protein